MKSHELFRPNGDGYDISASGALLLAASVIYGPPHETTPEGIRNAHALIDGVLAAARAGGFKQEDILRTLLARDHARPQLVALLQSACAFAGNDAICEVFGKLGIRSKGSSR